MYEGTAQIDQSVFEENSARGQGAAIHTTGSGWAVEVIGSTFLNNVADIGGALYLREPASVKIVETTFTPFVDGSATVFISGRLGGCAEHPCDPGFSCSYDKYSITCTPCEFPLVSTDGLSCVACLAGSGPRLPSRG